MNIAIQAESSLEEPIRVKRPLPNLLVQGFLLVLRNWPFVVWAYAINLVFGLLAGIPFATGLAPYLDHSLAAQNIAGTIDMNYLGELSLHLRESSFFPTAIQTAGWLNLVELLVLFVLFAGTIFAYVSAEPPQLSVLLRGGVAYFWRFVRAALMVGCVASLILGILLTARSALLLRASAVYVERKMFLFSAVSGGVVLLAALLLRLWFDLVEVYIVRNAMDGERRVRQALLPALKLMYRYFFRTVGSFLLTGMAGVGALALCLYLWKEFLPAHQVWIAWLPAQVGLFLLLATRFWQRGLETTLVMSADPPMVAAEDMASMVEEDLPLAAGVEALAGLSEPTLRELIAKLRTDPWASPDLPPGTASRPSPVVAPSPKLAPAPVSDSVLTPTPGQTEGNGPAVSLLDRHANKFPLGGLSPDPEPEKPDEIEKLPEDPERPARKGTPLH